MSEYCTEIDYTPDAVHSHVALATDPYSVDSGTAPMHDEGIGAFLEDRDERTLFAANAVADWRVAKSLLKLREQVNAEYPDRNKASDGTIGDAAHQGEGSASDHNPWVIDSSGVGVVRAFDITHDPAHGMDTYAMAERFRVARDHRVTYIISNRRITGVAHGWKWTDYTGSSDPHINHMHVSVSTTQSVYDNAGEWAGVTKENDMELSDVFTTHGGKKLSVGTHFSDEQSLRDLLFTKPADIAGQGLSLPAGSLLDVLVAAAQNQATVEAKLDEILALLQAPARP